MILNTKKIQFKRGEKKDLPILDLGEPAVTTDEKKLYVGTGTGNIEIASVGDLDGVSKEVADFKEDTNDKLLSKATTVEMNNRLNDIGVNQINKNKGLIDQTYLADELKQQMVGTTPINATPALYSITEDRMAFPVLEGRVNKNLFNKNTAIKNRYISHSNGNSLVPTDGSVVSASDFIHIEPNSTYTIKHPFSQRGAIYTQDKEFIESIKTDTFTVPTNAFYIRVSVRDADLSSQQVEKGTSLSDYNEAGVRLADENINDNSINAKKIKDNTVTENKLSFSPVMGLRSKNLFNKDTAIVNMFLTSIGSIRVVSDGTKLHTSDFIPVPPNQEISILPIYSGAIYNDKRDFVSRITATTFTTPSNGYYIRITLYSDTLDTMQVELGNLKTSYEQYGNKLKEESINYFSIAGNKLKFNSISDETLNFTPIKGKKGKNLFNRFKAESNRYIVLHTGVSTEPTDGSILSASEFIFVKPNTTYTVSNSFYMIGVFYDENKHYISQIPSTTFTTPSNGYYIRVTTRTNNLESMQVEEGMIATPYEPYRITLDESVSLSYFDTNYDENRNRMILPPKMFFIQEEKLPLYKTNFLASVSKQNNFFKTALSSIDLNGKPIFRYFLEDVLLDSYELSPSFRVNVKQYENQQYNYYNDIKTVSTPSTSAFGKKPFIINFGDSLTNRNIPQKLHDKLVSYGATPTMQGTMNNGGNFGEGREGWEYENFIGMDNTYSGSAITIQTTKGMGSLTTNPFLRLATIVEKTNHPTWCFRNTGSNKEISYFDDTNKTGDFYIFDMEHYITTQKFVSPDVITIALSTNDIWQGREEALSQSRLALEIMIKQIKKAIPECKIGVVPAPAWGSNDAGNMNWETYVVPWIENCMTDIANYQLTLTGIEVVPIWCHVNRDFNFPYDDSTSISSVNNSKRGTRREYVHWDEMGKLEYVNALSAYVLNVI